MNRLIDVSISKERGVVLVISLVFLALMTIVGVTAMQGTVQEEKMSNNASQRSKAFQNAEASLRAGENYLTGATLAAFNGLTTPGLIQPVAVGECDIVTYWSEGYCWNGNISVDCTTSLTTIGSTSCSIDSQEYASTDTTIAEQPRYVIEELPSSMATTGSSVAFKPLKDIGYYRVTARGVGGVSDTVVILQSTFRR